ncbi:hypothetical protein LCGC14_1919400, partial [marine sediment metagenome]
VSGGAAKLVRRAIDKTTTAESLGMLGSSPLITKSLTQRFAAHAMGKAAPLIQGKRVSAARKVASSSSKGFYDKLKIPKQASAPKEVGMLADAKAFFKTKMGKGIGIAALVAMIANQFAGKGEQHLQTMQTQQMQMGQMDQMAGTGDDQYYAAALPELRGQRREAQNAMLGTLLGGQGQQIQVPGERRIGGY